MRRTFWNQALLGAFALLGAPAALAHAHALELTQFGPWGWLVMEFNHAMYHLARYSEAFVVMASGQWSHGWHLMQVEAVCATATPVTGLLLGHPAGFFGTVLGLMAGLIYLARRYKQYWRRFPGGQGDRSIAHA